MRRERGGTNGRVRATTWAIDRGRDKAGCGTRYEARGGGITIGMYFWRQAARRGRVEERGREGGGRGHYGFYTVKSSDVVRAVRPFASQPAVFVHARVLKGDDGFQT